MRTTEEPGEREQRRRRSLAEGRSDGGRRLPIDFKSGVVLYFHTVSPGRNDAPSDNYFGTEGVHPNAADGPPLPVMVG